MEIKCDLHAHIELPMGPAGGNNYGSLCGGFLHRAWKGSLFIVWNKSILTHVSYCLIASKF